MHDLSRTDINPNAKNFSTNMNDMAVYLPSISAIYAKIVSMPEYKIRDSMPKGLPLGLEDLNFLNPKNNLYYYPAALYSAGHAILDVDCSNEQESMIQKRDRKNTIMIGDSGGFQVATGVLKWPWEQKNKTNDEWNSDKNDIRLTILRWLEATSDYAMPLDFPTYGLVKFGLDPVTGESLHPGMKTFNDCLTQSLENHHFFIKHRKEGATKFMNVLQGRNQEEGDIWWEAVKDLPFETWSFSNVQASNFNINLRRLIIMRDNGYLENREWLHYLGNGKIKAGCALTTLQRSLRQYVDPNLTLSYDAASPFVMSSRGQGYEGYELSNRNMGFKGGSFVDDKSLKGNKELFNDWIARTSKNTKFLKRTNVGDRITVGDICVRGYEDLKYKKVAWTKKELETDLYKNSPEGRVGDQFRWSKEYHDYLTHHSDHGGLFDFSESRFEKETEKYQVKWPSSMDGFSYLLSMCHNCELHIQAIQEANNWQDQELSIANQYVTPDLLEFKDLCPEIFKSEKPMDLIAKHTRLLQNITGMDASNTTPIDIENF
jgi:hypothetical protein